MLSEERVLSAIISNLKAQSERRYDGPYIDLRETKFSVIDGRVDLVALAKAIVESSET